MQWITGVFVLLTGIVFALVYENLACDTLEAGQTARPTENVLEVDQLIIRDKSGVTRVVLSAEALEMFGSNGKRRISIDTIAQNTTLRYWTSDGKPIISIWNNGAEEPGFAIGTPEKLRVQVTPDEISMRDRNSMRFELSTQDEDATLRLQDKNGKTRFRLGLFEKDDAPDTVPDLTLSDKTGRTRLAIGGLIAKTDATKTVSNCLSLYDRSGRAVWLAP